MAVSVTVSAYNRPTYLRQTLVALTRCDGVDRSRIIVIIDASDHTDEQVDICRRLDLHHGTLQPRAGCNKAIRTAFVYGFMGDSDYHVHLEDDTVPSRDALSWFAWARDRYRDDPTVLNVSGYQRVSNGQVNQSGLRRWFTPWGWATWRDRWDQLAAGWIHDESISWDVVINHALRAGRYEAFPTVSRIQNIGAERGVHVPSPEWHAANHHVPETADDLMASVTAWTEVRRDERADHE